MFNTTEEMRDEVGKIWADLRSGKISDKVARTLFMGAKLTLDSLKVEMEAARLGSSFGAVDFSERDRNRSGGSSTPAAKAA